MPPIFKRLRTRRSIAVSQSKKQLFALVRSEAQMADGNPAAIDFPAWRCPPSLHNLSALADIGGSRIAIPPGTKPKVITRSLQKSQREVSGRYRAL
jgi:hypothetical protein